VKIRLATIDDEAEILALCARYFGESVYAGATMNTESWRSIIGAAVSGDNPAWIIVAEDDGSLVGLSYLTMTRDMVLEGVAEVSVFYVIPEYRNGVAAILLRDATERVIAEQSKCRYSLIASSSGMGEVNDRANRMLWSRAGYTFLGSEMFRRRI